MHQESETSIIRRIQNGERDLFRHLVQAHMDNVFGIIYRQVGDRPLAEELAQEVFVKAFRAIKRFQFRSKFSTWLTRIAINTTHSYFTSKRYKQSIKNEEFEPRVHSGAQDSPEEEIAKRERMQAFQYALQNLKPQSREVIVLVALEGKKYEEASEFLSIPVGTVRSRLNTARHELKQLILAYAGEDPGEP